VVVSWSEFQVLFFHKKKEIKLEGKKYGIEKGI